MKPFCGFGKLLFSSFNDFILAVTFYVPLRRMMFRSTVLKKVLHLCPYLRFILCACALSLRWVVAQEVSTGLRSEPIRPSQSQEDSGIAFNEAKEIFDYHQIRGRKSLQSETGILEGELDFALQGSSRVQGMSSFGPQWSGNAHLLWDGSVGDSMESSFEVDRAGTYDLAIQLTLAGDYGIFRMNLPGTGVSRTIDLYSPRVELAPMLWIKDVQLASGSQSIVFELVGANDQARKFQNRGYLMGLDFLQLKPVEVAVVEQGSTSPKNVKKIGV